MPDIQLQDYTAKLKDLIQSGRLDEAIAHGQHILRQHPKHVETYCILGEACLEKGMFREAIEFFQRTLGADPENLIARVGLGVIYNQQGALPEAIWQMERAFELAPGNTEVRQELLRLYAQRDGVEKSRLKLTRGALGRLCSRNGLYERAINEFRAVLRQDPDLPDVRVAFAEALWREGRRLEAVDISQSLLDDLPFCLKANLILCEIWLRGGHEDAGEERLDLARALDPEGRIAREMMGKESPQPVEEIVIPELEVTPDLLEAAVIPVGIGTPVPVAGEEPLEEVEWIAEEEAEEFAEPWDVGEGMPDWLQEIAITEEEEPAPEPEAAVPSEEVALDEQVPDWLQELVGEETAPVTEAIEEKTPAPDEIPEWLREIEMEDLEEEIPSIAGAGEEESVAPAEIPEWLAEIEMSEEEEAIAPPMAEVFDKEPAPLGESEAPGEEAPLPEAEEFVEEAPVSVEEPEPVSPEAEIPGSLLALVAAGILSQADLESALEEMSPEELAAQQAESVPDWLQDLIGEEAPPVTEGLIAAGLDEEVPDWVREVEDAEKEELPPPVAEAAEEVVEPVDETRVEEIELIEELPAEEAEPVVEAQVEEFAPDEELPDWLRELGMAAAVAAVALPQAVEEPVEEEAAPPTAVEEPAEEEAAPPTAVEEPVEELPAEEVEPAAEVPVEEVAPDEELPDWLRELGMTAAVAEVAPPQAVEEPVDEEVVPPTAVAELIEEVEPVAEVPVSLQALVEAGLLDESDVGMAMAEMSPEDLEAQRAEAVPDWLQDLISAELVTAAAEEVTPPPAAEEPEEEIELIAEIPAEEEAPIEELPDWLREPEAPVPAEEAIAPPAAEELEEEIELIAEAPAEEAVLIEELPDWLREPEAPVPDEEAVAPPVLEERREEVEPVAEVPESLWALVEAGILDESDLEAAMAEMSPEEMEAQRAEAVPDWLQDVISEEAVPVEEATPQPVAEAPTEEIQPFEEEAPPVVEVVAEEALLAEEEMPPFEEEALPVVDVVAEEALLAEEEIQPFEEEAVPVVEVVAEEVLVVEEEIAPPLVEEPAAEELPVKEIAALPQTPMAEVQVAEEPAPPAEEAPAEEAPPVEEVAPPARLDELLTRLKAKPRDYAARLELARLYSAERDWNPALDHYEKLIAARKDLPAVIDDLTSLTQVEADQARVYQMLGDAHMQSEHLDEALEMYRLARQALARR